tara:strand:- start:1578 stop:1844 length:267 start_codon:yes stop_codon:yes gene_type:complete
MMYGDKPNNYEIKDNPQFVSKVKNYCKDVPKSRLKTLRKHYKDINNNFLATFKDCVWLMVLNTEIKERQNADEWRENKYENNKITRRP